MVPAAGVGRLVQAVLIEHAAGLAEPYQRISADFRVFCSLLRGRFIRPPDFWIKLLIQTRPVFARIPLCPRQDSSFCLTGRKINLLPVKVFWSLFRTPQPYTLVRTKFETRSAHICPQLACIAEACTLQIEKCQGLYCAHFS